VKTFFLGRKIRRNRCGTFTERSPSPSPPVVEEKAIFPSDVPLHMCEEELKTATKNRLGRTVVLMRKSDDVYLVFIPSRVKLRQFIDTIRATYGPAFSVIPLETPAIKALEDGSTSLILRSLKYKSNVIITGLHNIQAHTMLQMLTETDLWSA
jgi:hypothetical protein